MNVETPDQYNGLEPTRGSVTVNGVELSYLLWGSTGKPVVLLHGITSSARNWWRVAPALAAAGYFPLAFDLPGHGESDETSDHRMPALAALISEAMEALGFNQVTLIGHSWGGGIALELASGPASGKVARLVLVDPLLGLNPERGADVFPTYSANVGDPPAVTEPIVRANNPHWHTHDATWKIAALDRVRIGAVRGLFLESGDWHLLDRFANVPGPLLLMLADQQYTVVPQWALDELLPTLRPNLGEMVVVPGTDHNLMRGTFEPFMNALLPWLQRTDPTE